MMCDELFNEMEEYGYFFDTDSDMFIINDKHDKKHTIKCTVIEHNPPNQKHNLFYLHVISCATISFICFQLWLL